MSTGVTWVYQTFKTAAEMQEPGEYIRSNINNKGWSNWIKLTTNDDLRYKLIDMAGADAIAVPPGRWCAINTIVNGELGEWYVETVEFDAFYRTVTAFSYLGTKRYYYFAKMNYGVWQGWEKYISAV